MMRKLLLFFIYRDSLAILLFLLVVVSGVLAYRQVPKELFPKRNFPLFTIETRYQSYAAELVEKIITKPMEESLNRLKNVKDIYSRTQEGKSTVRIEFYEEADFKSSLIDLYEIVDAFALAVPSDSEKPQIFNYDPNSRPDLNLSFISDRMNPNAIREYVEKEIQPLFKAVPGVANVEVFGGALKEVAIELKEEKLRNQDFSHKQVHSALFENNYLDLIGEVGSGDLQIPVFLDQRLRSMEDIRSLKAVIGEKVQRLDELAEVSLETKENEVISRMNGEKNVSVVVHINKNASILQVGGLLEEKWVSIEKELEGSALSMDVVYSRAKLIDEKLNEVYLSLGLGLLLLVLFCWFVLHDTRHVFLILLAFPFSLGGMFVGFVVTDTTLNLFTLVGIAIGAGMVVDAALIMIEAIEAKQTQNERGLFRVVMQVATPISIGVLTSIIVFVPFFMAPTAIRFQFMDMSLAIVFSLLTSLIYSLFVLPAFYQRFSGSSRFFSKQGSIKRVPFVSRLGVHAGYMRVLSVLTGYVNFFYFFSGVLVLALCLSLFTAEYDIQPVNPDDSVHLRYDFEPGMKLARMDDLLQKAGAILTHTEFELKRVSHKVSKYVGEMSLALDDTAKQQDFIAEIKAKLKEPQEEWNTRGSFRLDGQTAEQSGRREVRVEVSGPAYPQLKEGIQSAVEALRGDGEVERIWLNYRDDFVEYALYPRSERLFSDQVSLSQIAEQINMEYAGYIATKYLVKEDKLFHRDIKVTSKTGTNQSLDQLLGRVIKTDHGDRSVSSLFSLAVEKGQSDRSRKNRSPYLGFTVQGKEGVSLSRLASSVEKALGQVTYPDRVFYHLHTGESLSQTVEYLAFYFLAVFYLIYLCCASFYHSFKKPGVFFLAIFFSLMPAILWIMAWGNTYSLSYILALAVLVGLSVNNVSLLLDALAEKKVAAWVTLKDFVSSLPLFRRSVLTSTFSTLVALLPGAMGSNVFFSELSVVVIIGLLANLFFVFVLFPVMLTKNVKNVT